MTKKALTGLDLLAAIRGGWPKACDFCKRPYTKGRYPVPEEAGEWACSECVARWEAKEKTHD